MSEEREINLAELSLEQLNTLKNQFEQELRQLSSSFSGLKEAQGRFGDAKSALGTITPQNQGKQILVPLTSSMYVPGSLSNVSEVLVDIGTGYYVEKDIEGAKDFMDRKINFLEKNTDSLTEVIETKRKNLEILIGIMQDRIRSSQASRS